ncbi:hypothetical protein RhiTH_003632, partial [Rhizoctonia solani]
MSRKLRSRCNYNASKVPTTPKRQANKCKAPNTASRMEPKMLNKTIVEQAIVPARRVQLTFGTMPHGARDIRELQGPSLSGYNQPESPKLQKPFWADMPGWRKGQVERIWSVATAKSLLQVLEPDSNQFYCQL